MRHGDGVLFDQAVEVLREALEEPDGHKRLLLIERALHLHRADQLLKAQTAVAAVVEET